LRHVFTYHSLNLVSATNSSFDAQALPCENERLGD
jgi:hypothetical protein